MTLPSLLISPLCATSSTPNLLIVLTSLRFLLENIWIRLPLVTANVSMGVVVLLGKEICVIGFECGEGMSCGDRKLRQYLCSEVMAAGPDGSFMGCRAVTAAAMVNELM